MGATTETVKGVYNLERLQLATIEEVLPLLKPEPYRVAYKKVAKGKRIQDNIPKEKVVLHGHEVCVNSLRLSTFKLKGTQCVVCGVPGNYFAIEKAANQSSPHLNLYSLVGGLEILMTVDHIIPKSKGGKDVLANTQVMCFNCNAEKADALVKELNTFTVEEACASLRQQWLLLTPDKNRDFVLDIVPGEIQVECKTWGEVVVHLDSWVNEHYVRTCCGERVKGFQIVFWSKK